MGFFSQPASRPPDPSNLYQLFLFLFISPEKGKEVRKGCLIIQYIGYHSNYHFQNGTLSLPSLVPGIPKSGSP